MKAFMELFTFIRENKKWWLIPLILMILLISLILYLGHGSVVSPFIYTFL